MSAALLAQVADAGGLSGALARRSRWKVDERALAEAASAQFRASDVAERARTALQRRGWMVCRAETVGGPAALWKVSGTPGFIDDEALIVMAEKRGGNFTREFVVAAPAVPVATPAAAPAAESELD